MQPIKIISVNMVQDWMETATIIHIAKTLPGLHHRKTANPSQGSFIIFIDFIENHYAFRT
jgi:hypothetical protein